MKKLFATFALIFLLSGCVTVPTYDAVEYNHYVELTNMVRQAPQYCESALAPALVPSVIDQLANKSNILKIHATYRPKHDDIKELITIINKNIEEMRKTYNESKTAPSVAYCKGKFMILDAMITRVLNSMGGLPQ